MINPLKPLRIVLPVLLIFMLNSVWALNDEIDGDRANPQSKIEQEKTLAHYHQLLDQYDGVYDENAVSYCQQIIAEARKQNDAAALAYAYSRLGDVRKFLQDDSLAVEAFDKAAELYSRQGLRDSLGKIYFSLVELHQTQNQINKAISRQESLLELNEFFGDKEESAKAKLKLASLIASNQKVSKAKKLVNESFEYFTAKADTVQAIESKQILISIYQSNREYRKALNEINSALKLIGKHNTDLKAVLLYQKSLANIELNQSSEAVSNLKSALEIAQSLNESQLISSISGQLVNVLENMQQYREALQYHKLHMKSREAVLTQSGVAAISAIGNQLKIQNNNDLSENSEAEKANKSISEYTIFNLILLGSTFLQLILIIYLLLANRSLKKRIRKAKSESGPQQAGVDNNYEKLIGSLSAYANIFEQLRSTISHEKTSDPDGTIDNSLRIIESLPKTIEALSLFTSLEAGEAKLSQNTFSLSVLFEKTIKQAALNSSEYDFEVHFNTDERLYSKYRADEKLTTIALHLLIETVIESNMSGDIHLFVVPSGENLNLLEFYAGNQQATKTYEKKKYDVSQETGDMLPGSKTKGISVSLLKKAVALMGGRFYTTELNPHQIVFSIMVPMKGIE